MDTMVGSKVYFARRFHCSPSTSIIYHMSTSSLFMVTKKEQYSIVSALSVRSLEELWENRILLFLLRVKKGTIVRNDSIMLYLYSAQ